MYHYFAKYTLLLTFLAAVNAPTRSQTPERKDVTLEEIWQFGTFQPNYVRGIDWMSDGRYYTSLRRARQGSYVVQYNIRTGQPTDTIVDGSQLDWPTAAAPAIDGYAFNQDASQVLLLTERKSIYRRSYQGRYYVYDRNAETLKPLSAGGAQSYATFSPDGKHVAFVRDNNLFVVEVASMEERAVTTDGTANELIHGSADWVYEEEFSFAKGFFWSPDSKKIAYYSFDERAVPEYNMQVWGDLYPEDYRFKYPKAGETNAVVAVSVYDLSQKSTQAIDVGPEKDQYLPRLGWTRSPNLLSIRRMNRLQNKLEIIHADARTGQGKVVYTEESPAYIDILDDLYYLKNGEQFIYTNEEDGYRHVYLYGMDGTRQRQLTKGSWEVLTFLGVDEQEGLFYYTSSEVSPLEAHLYRANLKGKRKEQLTEGVGTHAIDMSPDFSYYIDTYAQANVPPVVTLHRADGRQLETLESNADLRAVLKEYRLSPLEFFELTTEDDVTLNAWRIRPPDFDPAKKYPVLMYTYGGPGSQTVSNTWLGPNYFWYQMLAQQGYIVISVDNRGTGARGAKFRQATYANLGKYEAQDQIAAARYLATLPHVDPGRIGIWGWSFGGYLSSLCITLGADVFDAAIAVAPVTNWRFYDTIYTERYLKTPQENPEGYDANSPVTYADRLEGDYLLIHGTGDDNVHFQNAVAMEEALIRAGKQFQSFYYPNRNHGIYGGNTRLHLYQLMTNFLLEKL